MARIGPFTGVITLGLLGIFIGLFAGVVVPAVQHQLDIFGVFRTPATRHNGDLVLIPNTLQCEDMHYYAPSTQIFAVCQKYADTRYGWFPPVGNLANATLAWESRGMFTVVNPENKESTVLSFDNFDSPFVTHGLDIISDPEQPEGTAVYLFAVNHLPNPSIYPSDGSPRSAASWKMKNEYENAKAHSQIEIFYHTLGSSTIRHVRSVLDPLIRTPNDIYADSPTSFYVTNDHRYREGPMRLVEDSFSNGWTDVVHVQLSADALKMTDDATQGIQVTKAKTGLFTANGLGRGSTPDEIILAGCNGGEAYLCERKPGSLELDIKDTISVNTIVDNPTYFSDPYTETGGDASGYLLSATSKPLDLVRGLSKLGATVWYVKPGPAGTPANQWGRRIIFEDDGSQVKCATTAILVGIDPKKEDGLKKGWLFVTGFFTENITAIKVAL